MIYGYCRISTKQQNIDRQERNILSIYPDAVIVKEAYTGTKLTGRKELDKILKKVKAGDTIVFDRVSRMSRNANEGWKLYQELYDKGVELVFLKESYVNTATYKSALKTSIPRTGSQEVDWMLDWVDGLLKHLAQKQIVIAFEQAQKEVDDLHQRTREGMATARLEGKQIGQKQGAKLNVKKAAKAKETIKRLSKSFCGTLSDAEVMKVADISRNTYYKYKRELLEEEAAK